jgi:RNA polymerase sigma-70 factor (ECF subfamily)
VGFLASSLFADRGSWAVPRAEPLPVPWSDPAEGAMSERPTFDQLFSEHARYVGRTLRFLGISEANLEDACQEVFVIVHRRLREFDHEGSARSWIRQICVHVAQNERRRVRRRREDTVEEPLEIATPPAQHGNAERSEMRTRLLALLDTLSEDQRRVFVLYEIEQLSMAEVAVAVSCPLQTAYSRLHAARERITLAVQKAEVNP